MAKFRKIYVRRVKEEIGRYANWPIQRFLKLGYIGFYNGRKADCEWFTNLDKLGIILKPLPAQSLRMELYTSGNSVNLTFSIADSSSYNTASFSFSKNASVATQGLNLSFSSVSISDLEIALIDNINNNKLKWNKNWVILTEIWESDSFTTLISGGKSSKAEISTNVPVASGSFNIADISLGVHLSASNKMAYTGVAERNLQPYFHMHKLIFDKKGRPLYLKKYGKY
jgi:hypothetical protein